MFHYSKLKALRKKNGLTQEEVADKLCISQSVYARIENGKSNSWSAHLDKICCIFKVDVSFFFCEAKTQQGLYKQSVVSQYEKSLVDKDLKIETLENKIKNLETSIKLLKDIQLKVE